MPKQRNFAKRKRTAMQKRNTFEARHELALRTASFKPPMTKQEMREAITEAFRNTAVINKSK